MSGFFDNLKKNQSRHCYDDIINDLKGQHTAGDYNSQSHCKWRWLKWSNKLYLRREHPVNIQNVTTV